MGESGIPYVVDAEKYLLGQNLNKRDVEEIRKCLWYSLACEAGLEVCYHMLLFFGEPFNMDFHHFLMSLMWDPRVPDESNWSEALWDSMEPKDRTICHKIMRENQRVATEE